MKKILSLLLAITFLVAAAAPTFAAAPDPILPQYINTSQASISLTISANGLATVAIQCIGLSSCTGIDAEVYLEYKDGNNWVRVDLGNATDTWTVSSSTKFLIKSFTHTVSERGDYRATVNYTIYGTAQTENLTFYSTRTF